MNIFSNCQENPSNKVETVNITYYIKTTHNNNNNKKPSNYK